MDFIEGIEGDYLETKKDSLIFDVKGLLHPNDRTIAFLRFFPHPEGKRIKSRMHFKKVYELNERYALLREKYPNYIFFSEELDLEIQGVKKQEIKKFYTPRSFTKKLFEKNIPSNSEKLSIDLCELFITEANISENNIGVTGSIMVGLNTEDSDIDIIIYGTEISIEFQKKIEMILRKSNNCRKYNLEEFKSHYDWRVGGSKIPFEDFLRSEQRKLHQGKYMNQDFFVRYIKSPKDWKGKFSDYRYKNFGRIKLKARINDSTDSIFTPCSYKITPIKMLENNIKSDQFNVSSISEINSFRGRFCEQAKDSETVIVEGKLERVNFKDKLEFFRILLSDPIQDKMIII